MLTYPQYILKSQDVYTFTINTLDTLPLNMPGAIQSLGPVTGVGLCCCLQAFGPSSL